MKKLIVKGKIQRKTYRIPISRRPKIYAITSEIYYSRETQRIRYEEDILPKREQDTHHSLRI